jgi:hypothetical protein
MSTVEERIKKLEEMTEVQLRDGNWNYDPYMHGMANGLIFALNLLRGDEGDPPYKSAPERWLADRKMSAVDPVPCEEPAS